MTVISHRNASLAAAPLRQRRAPPLPANDTHIGQLICARTANLRDQPTITMSLEGVPSSFDAHRTVDHIFLLLDGTSLAVKSRGKFREATAAAVYDLLATASHNPFRPCYRPMSMSSFTGHPIGYHNVKRALDALARKGFINRAGGNFDRNAKVGTTTRIVPTQALLDELGTFGITPINRHQHFQRRPSPKRPDELVLLNTASSWVDGRRQQGKRAPVDFSHPIVAARVEQIGRLNAFMAAQVIDGADNPSFRCIFNKGDSIDHDYAKGGRLWCIGGGYQAMPKADRRAIQINGQPTVELDIGSSHLTIFLAKNGISFDPSEDLYSIAGFDRQVIKWMVNLTLSQQRKPTRWPRDFVEEYREKFGQSLIEVYPFNRVRQAVLDKHPFLRDRDCIDMDWADLQFIEAEAIISAVSNLCKIGVPTLPVHDSLIVRINDILVSEYVLRESFRQELGVYPIVKASYQPKIK